MQRRVIAVLTVLALAGCGADPGAPAPAPSRVAPTQAATGEPARPVPGGTLVSFGRSGGIAGVDDKFIVGSDGTYTIQTRTGTKQGKLTEGELTELRTVLRAANFRSIPRVNDGGEIADGFLYNIVHDSHEVVAEDGGIPPALEPVIGALNKLLTRHQG